MQKPGLGDYTVSVENVKKDIGFYLHCSLYKSTGSQPTVK